MRRIRGGSGLGDALYVRPFVEYFAGKGEKLVVCTDWPDVFRGLSCERAPFDRLGIQLLAHYTLGKRNPSSTQWEDVCASVGVRIPFSINWSTCNEDLIKEVRSKAAGRAVVLLHGGRTPMGRQDGFGRELLPLPRAFEAVLQEFRDCFIVRVGLSTDIEYELPCSLDLTGKTSVADLLDLGKHCDGVIGQCSLAVPLAEAFDKPLVAVWAEKGLTRAPSAYIRQITPKKILSKPTSMWVLDSWSDDQIRLEVQASRLMSA